SSHLAHHYFHHSLDVYSFPTRRSSDLLAAGVWSENIKTAHHVARKLKAGTVWVNDYGLEMEGAPFGGYKKSGTGRELGSYALDEDRKSTRLNSSHVSISYAVFCLKKES